MVAAKEFSPDEVMTEAASFLSVTGGKDGNKEADMHE